MEGNEYNCNCTEKGDEGGTRDTWAILTWVILVLTLVLNLVLICILVIKRNLYSLINKCKDLAALS